MFRSRYYALRTIKHEFDKVNHLKNMFKEEPGTFVAKDRGHYFATNMSQFYDKRVEVSNMCNNECSTCDCFQYYTIQTSDHSPTKYKLNLYLVGE